jgi:(1->4)-alpha-D-glucan 1-alpha-D-glucosylmutase
MLATSTHDNKRSEDVRNRIDVLSEMPDEWMQALSRWHGLCRARARSWKPARRRRAPTNTCCTRRCWAPCRWAGSMPATATGFADRIWQYMQKAAREAKLRTRWSHPDADYEAALEGFVRELLADSKEGGCLRTSSGLRTGSPGSAHGTASRSRC